ncbi:MAG: DUF899 family protein [Rhodopirellula sp. JB044]|uniref:DUF899 family protein n=1 Tax=Rhodopirellula sp. JB044 TaxID=3342844 RepID=UPI003709C86E
MKFICMGFVDESKWEGLSEQEAQKKMKECLAYDDELRRGGHFIGGEALQSARNAVTLRAGNGSVDVCDGPFAETKEMLGGILFLEARDLNHAISLMSHHPGVSIGPFEIRPADETVNAMIAAREAVFQQTREDESNGVSTASPSDHQTESPTGLPAIVCRQEWRVAIERLREKEKEHTRNKDALSAERRRLPMVKIEKEYVFEGTEGPRCLGDLFDGRRQLAIYHFMFAENVGGWPDAGCVGCSTLVDHLGPLAHIHARDLSLALVSRAPLSQLEPYKKRMNWQFPWYSSSGTTFNEDFGVSTPQGEQHALSIFLRDGDDMYQTYFTEERGCETLMSHFTLLDMAPFGRQETWEDSPRGWPQTEPYSWWRRHDEYEHLSLTQIQS